MIRVAEIAALVGGRALGRVDLELRRLATLESADAASVAFLANPRYRSQLATTAAGCVLLAPGHETEAASLASAVICEDPYLAFARLTQWWAAQTRERPAPGVHASAVVEAGARVPASASIGPLAVVAAGAVLGADVVVGAHAVIGAGASVGAGSWLKARTTVAEGCRVGARAIVHSGAVIGADGFGFAPHDGRWVKIEQLGAVVVGDDVEIGANSCVDRGALEDTVLEDGVKLDNLVQVGHNVRVGAHSALAGCVGIAGSARIGRRCSFGGGAIVLGHLELADDVHVSAATVVTRSIRKAGLYSGVFPIDDNAAWEKNAATLKQLHALRERLRALEHNR